MNSDESQTSDPHRLVFDFSDKINLKAVDKSISLLNLIICYKIYKGHIEAINLKYQLQYGMINLNCPIDQILYNRYNSCTNY